MTSLRRLALVSFLILFLELLLIRLIGTDIRIFAYLGNLLLLSIFVGSGIGMYGRKPLPLAPSAVILFLLTAATSVSYILRTPRFDVKLFSGISELLAPLSEAYIWQQLPTMSKTGAALGIILTIGLLLLVGAAFVPLGNLLGRLLAKHPKPIAAYSVNVAASLLGMWVFQLFSIAEFPPLLGLSIAAGSLVLLAIDRHDRTIIIASTIGIIALATPRVSYQPYEGPVTFWSPYQKLTLSLINPQKPYHAQGYYLEVNNTGYMGLLNLDDERRASASALLMDQGIPADDIPYLDHYLLPFLLKPGSTDALIIGAGGGNDVAAAIRAGVRSIDAVDIDPTILRIGRQYHPEFPYQDRSVRSITDDGRAFMERTNRTYDLIVMGLADSHTLTPSLTNLRLDHYLYTKEAMQRARDLLKSDGVFVVSFEVTRPWIGSRIARTITDAFGREPLVAEVRSDGAFGWGGYVFVVAKNPNTLVNTLRDNPDLARFINANSRSLTTNASRPKADPPLAETMNSLPINPLTDDWPYLYLDRPRLPLIHLLVGLLLIAAIASAKKTVFPNRLDLPMFFWGAGFMLFEFQNITKMSLLFGLTWQTNMIVITAALLLILLANFAVERKFLSSRNAFIGLLLALGLQLVFPLHALNRFAFWPKLLVAGTLLNLPFFFGGVIFATWFARTKDRSGVFASNLLGAAIGGLLEMLSFRFGLHTLLLVTAGLYAIGWIVHERRAVQ